MAAGEVNGIRGEECGDVFCRVRLIEIEEQREIEAVSAVIGPGSKEEAAIRLRAGGDIGDAISGSARPQPVHEPEVDYRTFGKIWSL